MVAPEAVSVVDKPWQTLVTVPPIVVKQPIFPTNKSAPPKVVNVAVVPKGDIPPIEPTA